MSNTIEMAITKLAHAIACHPSVRAIGMSGGERSFPEPGEGDIDLFIYCTEIPPDRERQAMLMSLPEEIEGVDVGHMESGHWGKGDCFVMRGLETWLLYFTVAESYSELEAILDGQYLGRLDSYYYPIGRCAMWKAMRIFYDPDGILESFKRRLEEYPTKLRWAVIHHHLQALEDVEDLERAVHRKDIFFFHFALDLALDHYMQAVFGLNQEYFPSRKRSEVYLQRFKVKPDDCEGRLCQVIALGSKAETLALSYEIWRDLVHDLRVLVETGG